MIEKQWIALTDRFTNIALHEFVVMPNHFHAILQIIGTDPGAHNTGTVASNETVGEMVDAFKSITTVEYIREIKNSGWKPLIGKLWQRNYYEHIIRNEQSYQTIASYIVNNPAKWNDDKYFNPMIS
jgi:REP element-mobilizing transposase RayT